ncbi:MAG: hypothetical protein BM564_13560 [Bacteroidetes bacterium MedPE-SWsnd-G2]|nr:MAG: hypothetical protein BM564_13560 [Bacteroidetes bacterium MedPE-SWsnd-G2]
MLQVDKTIAPAKQVVSQGMALQSYCNSVLQQPNVDFSKFPNLVSYQKQINSGLATAKSHANNYLNVIQPQIIHNINDIDNYFQLLKSIPTSVPSGSSKETWINALKAIEQQTTLYSNASNVIVLDLGQLNTNLGTDAASFSSTVSLLNAAVNGDNGVLDQLNHDISKVDGQIAGAIAGTALSGLAIIGGVFMIAVGAIADFFTAGTSTPLIVGGVAVLAIGIGGEVASAITLKNLYKEKTDMLQKKSTLTAEVNLALGMSSAYGQLKTQAQSAMAAATQMKSAWTSLGGDLSNMASDLNNGITSTDALRTLWLNTANNLIPTVEGDISTIKAQLAGIQTKKVTTSDLGTFIVNQANAA